MFIYSSFKFFYLLINILHFLSGLICFRQEAEMNETSHGDRAPVGSIVAWSLVFGGMALAIITGNSVAIAVLTRRKLLRRRTNYFLISLALADMTVGIFSVPTFIYQLVCFWQNGYVTQWTALNITKVLDVLCGLAPTFTLTVIAQERVCAICFPLRHRTSTRRLYDASISCVWILVDRKWGFWDIDLGNFQNSDNFFCTEFSRKIKK